MNLRRVDVMRILRHERFRSKVAITYESEKLFFCSPIPKKWNKWTWTVFFIWNIVQQTFKKHSNNRNEMKNSRHLWRNYGTRKRKEKIVTGKSKRFTAFILANFLQTYCYVENIWAKPREMERKKRIDTNTFRSKYNKMKQKNTKKKNRISFATSFTFYSPWTLCLRHENAKEAEAIVSQWCIRFECASCGMCTVGGNNFPRQLKFFLLILFPFPSFSRSLPIPLPFAFSHFMTDSHDVQAISCRTAFIWNFKYRVE